MKFDYSNIVGKKFGKLTVVSMLNNRYVVCRCECGNEKVVNKYTLVGGTAAKSCGCSARHRADATETLQDMIGRRYGRLVVTAIAEEGSAASKAIVHCKCDCGNEKDVFAYHLRHGFTKSCGCIRKESARTKGKTNGAKHNEEFMGNIVGRRFGRLTVTGYKKPPKFVHDVVHCKCDCGNEKDVTIFNLKSGNTKSCGCLKKEHVAQSQHERAKRRAEVCVGQRFGKLVAKEVVFIDGEYKVRCDCDCGVEKIVSYNALNSGRVKSCGCLRKENMANVQKHMMEKRRKVA